MSDNIQEDSFSLLSSLGFEHDVENKSVAIPPVDQGFSNGDSEERLHRKKGVGHPYRMRLNMAGNQSRSKKKKSEIKDSEKKHETKRIRADKQGRHPYRRGFSTDGVKRQSGALSSCGQVFVSHDEVAPELDDCCKNNNESYQASSSGKISGDTKGRNVRNSFACHQRVRRKHQATQANRNDLPCSNRSVYPQQSGNAWEKHDNQYPMFLDQKNHKSGNYRIGVNERNPKREDFNSPEYNYNGYSNDRQSYNRNYINRKNFGDTGGGFVKNPDSQTVDSNRRVSSPSERVKVSYRKRSHASSSVKSPKDNTESFT